MILDLVFTGTLLAFVLFSRILPLQARHDFLCLLGLIGLYLYAPVSGWILSGFVLLGSHLWLRRRNQFFYGFYGLWGLWIILFWALSFKPVLIGRFEPIYFLTYNLQRILHFIIEDHKGKMRTSTLRSFWHYSFLMPLLLGTVEWFHDYYSTYKRKVLPILWREGFSGLAKGFLKCYLAAFLLVYFVEPVFMVKEQDWFLTENFALIFMAVVSVGISFTLNVWGTFDLARALMALLGYRLERRIFGPVWRAKSVIEFWSNWNIPVVVFVREYIYIPFITLFSQQWKKALVFIILLMWMHQSLIHGSLWAYCNFLAIYMQIRWAEYKAYRPDIKRLYDRFVPVFVRRLATLSFIGLTSVIWPLGSTEGFFLILYNIPLLAWEFLYSVTVYIANLILLPLQIA